MAKDEKVFQYNLNYASPNSGTWVDFPKAPSKFTKEMMQVVTNSNRTVGKGALLHKDLLADKHKYNLTWYMLTPDEADALEKLFRNHNFFAIRYKEKTGLLDVSGGFVTRVMYGGDQSSEVALINPNTGHVRFYLNVTWNLIER